MTNRFFHFLDLRSEVEAFDTIHAEIEKGIVFKGTNLWVLVFAIIIASVGLNTNSTAVIIGAMLISPLMGPINGMGYSIATYNFALFRTSFKNLAFAVGASLLASTIYFIISPVSTAHSELLARTSPTIYDVLIALFGGLAGILAISSKQKGNVLPGVAIATALMPPLCTAGYGLASGQFNFFLGAFYLFTINAVFIGISSVIMSKVLKFPIDASVKLAKRNQVNRWLYAIITVTLLPSIYFGYRLVGNERFKENASMYVKKVTVMDGCYLLKNDINSNKREIRLVYGGNLLTDTNKTEIKRKAHDFELDDCKLTIEQGFSLNAADEGESQVLENQLHSLTSALQMSERKVDTLKNKPLLGKQLLFELQSLFPQLTACSFSETIVYSSVDSTGIKTALVLLSVPAKSLQLEDKERIGVWLRSRLPQLNSIKVYFEEKLDEKAILKATAKRKRKARA